MFSAIIDFIKDVISAVVDVIASVVGAIFGTSVFTPLLVALAAFAVAVWVVSPYVIGVLLANSPWTLLQVFPTLCSLAVSVIVQAVALVDPNIGKTLGFISGLISFVLFLPTIASFTSLGASMAYDVEKIFGAVFAGLFDLAEWQISALFATVSSYTVTAFLVGASGGSTSPFMTGWINGFTAIPEVVVTVADAAVSSLAGSFAGFLLIGLGAYLLIRSTDRSERASSKPRAAISGPDPGRWELQLAGVVTEASR